MRIVSGIQPTGNLHLGNYLGAIRNWVKMQDQVAAGGGTSLYFLADLHAISMPHEPAQLRDNTFEMTAPTAYLPVEVDFPEMLLVGESAANNSANYDTVKTGSNRVTKTWHAASLGYIPVQAIQYRDTYERRNGYSWYGPYARDLLEKDYPKWKQAHP